MKSLSITLVFILINLSPLFAQYEWLPKYKKQKVDSLKKILEAETFKRQQVLAEVSDSLQRVQRDSAMVAIQEDREKAKLEQGKIVLKALEALSKSDTTSLQISYTSLKQIPFSVYRLKKLERLSFTSSELEEISPNLTKKLIQLKWLNLNANQLTSNAIKFAKNTTIKRLMLAKNQLLTIPKSIKKLKGLEYLDLSGNRLGNGKRVKIRKLKNLESLDLSQNNLTEIPRGLQKLKKLKRLKLDKNQISDLKRIKKLKNLKELTVSFNPIDFGPKECFYLKNLSRLVMQKCELIYISTCSEFNITYF